MGWGGKGDNLHGIFKTYFLGKYSKISSAERKMPRILPGGWAQAVLL